MIVDTSAIVAIAFAEPDAPRFVDALRDSDSCKMSSATYVETGVVLDRRHSSGTDYELDAMVRTHALTIVELSPAQARIARQAYRQFGKGSGHRAQLNFGDCFAYALAVDSGEPLLYKGDDLAATGIRGALPDP